MAERPAPKVYFATTGVANLASIMAAFRRAPAEPVIAASPEELSAADYAVVPGVGSFGSAMEALTSSGMAEAIRDRVSRGRPTMGVCAGMQVFFEGSEESPGVAGMGIARGLFRRFPSDLPVPQLGWNRVSSRGVATNESQGALVREGWAYFANSYRLTEPAEGLRASWAEYGAPFVAALEGPRLLLCQFHPELSGPWGLGLLRSWLEAAAENAGGSA